MNTKLMPACDGQDCPINLFVTAGSDSDYIDARALLSSIPNVDWLLEEPGRDVSQGKQARYKGRNCIETMFGGFKNWRRAATRHHRCSGVFQSAIALTETVIH